MLDSWYIPSSSGDYRLEPIKGKPDLTMLTVNDPTPSETERLEAFKRRCLQWKWMDADAVILPEGTTELVINAPIGKCGKHLSKEAGRARGTLTAVRSVDGEVTYTIDHTESEQKMDKATTDPKSKKATTVKAPTRCCPDPVDGPLKRSSEVLREFCTPSQWAEWGRRGWLHCVGGLTGSLYRLVHRHHPLARKQGKICYGVDDECVLHFWDWTVPPAEEVLAAMLILQHREPWLRNRSTMLTFGSLGERFARDVFENPIGNSVSDGTWDSAMYHKVADQSDEIAMGVTALAMLASV